ncbi:MAG: helix-turn-helix domain-containing protein [Caulobacteraceae bacterium]
MTEESKPSAYAEKKARAATLSGPGDKLSYMVGEAAHAIGISTTTVWTMVREGQIRTFKIGARTLIKRAEQEGVIERAERQAA